MSKKRKIEGITKEDDLPAPKKIKISIPHSNLFQHPLDNKSYEHICRILITDCDILPIFARHIAEFSTGDIKQCDRYGRCKNTIHMLYDDLYIYPEDTDCDDILWNRDSFSGNEKEHISYRWKKECYRDDTYNHNNGKEQLFCSECSYGLTSCGYESSDAYCSALIDKYCYCGIEVTQCTHWSGDHWRGSYCYDCERNICGECTYHDEKLTCTNEKQCKSKNVCVISLNHEQNIIWLQCDRCAKLYCHKCMDKELRKCVACDKNICGNCIVKDEQKCVICASEEYCQEYAASILQMRS
eukprot:314875_1